MLKDGRNLAPDRLKDSRPQIARQSAILNPVDLTPPANYQQLPLQITQFPSRARLQRVDGRIGFLGFKEQRLAELISLIGGQQIVPSPENDPYSGLPEGDGYSIFSVTVGHQDREQAHLPLIGHKFALRSPLVSCFNLSLLLKRQ